VLGDLLAELDRMDARARLLALVQGVLAANIFDWGAQACVDLYHDGTILEIYQKARRDIQQRPWRVDDFDALSAAWFAQRNGASNAQSQGAPTALGAYPQRASNAQSDSAPRVGSTPECLAPPRAARVALRTQCRRLYHAACAAHPLHCTCASQREAGAQAAGRARSSA
jgi:Damage-control phosphatase ARMT1-like domain